MKIHLTWLWKKAFPSSRITQLRNTLSSLRSRGYFVIDKLIYLSYSRGTSESINQMSEIERVEPVIKEGIEFYVKSDGSECGVSQVGFSRLGGLSEVQGRRILTAIEVLSDRRDSAGNNEITSGSAFVKEIASYVAARLSVRPYLEVSSNQQAKILHSQVVRYNDKGYKLQPVQAYPMRHFPLIRMCFSKLVQK
jgi:hypothetical protein